MCYRFLLGKFFQFPSSFLLTFICRSYYSLPFYARRLSEVPFFGNGNRNEDGERNAVKQGEAETGPAEKRKKARKRRADGGGGSDNDGEQRPRRGTETTTGNRDDIGKRDDVGKRDHDGKRGHDGNRDHDGDESEKEA